jgi:tripartite-type tricarboxylate transporter receptor subunit TctC
MKTNQSVMLKVILATVASLAFHLSSAQDSAESYPNRPIRLVIGTSAGSGFDVSARVIAEGLSKILGQVVFVEPQPGAGGVLSMRNFANAKPDGYTLLYYWNDMLDLVPLTFLAPPYDGVKDFAHLGFLTRTGGLMLVIPPSSPAKNFAEFARIAKNAPKQLTFGSSNNGSQLSFEIMSGRIGAPILHVPYKTSTTSYQAAMVGEIDIVSGVSFAELVKSGRLRAIAIGGNKRAADFPDVPTLVELGMGDDIFLPNNYGIIAPAATPKSILAKLSDALDKLSKIPEFAERLKPTTLEVHRTTPKEATAVLRRNVERNQPLLRKLGLVAN